MKPHIKNMPREEVVALADLVQIQAGQVVTVLSGEGTFTVDGKPHDVKAGESLLMPAKKPHSVYGKEAFKWLLTVVFPTEKKSKKD